MIGPDTSPERFIGAQYRMDMHYFQKNLAHLYRLPDVSIRTGEGLLEPGRSCYGVAFVPKNYLPKHILDAISLPYLRYLAPDKNPDKMAAIYLKYLLERRLTSTKSKLAQSGWEIIADFGTDPYLKFEIEINDRGFYFPMWIRNLNPKITFRTPDKPFPAFRFFIPGRKLEGQELLDQTQIMQLRGVTLEDQDALYYPPHELDALESTNPLLFKDSDNPVSSLIVPIEKEAEFIQEKTIKVQDLLDCPSKDRAGLDKLLGLRWRSPGQRSLPVDGEEVMISESGPLIMPEGTAGIIDHQYNWLNNFQFQRPPERGMMRHITSPLIDPGFGLPDGQPIRFESHKRAVFEHNFHFVRMFLHPSD